MKPTKPFKSRNEVFGKVVYNPNELEYSFMTNKDFLKFKSENEIVESQNIPYYENPLILYSPIRTYFDITLACNLNCKTCLNNSGKSLNSELSIDDSLKIIEGLSRDFVLDIKFSGGEPTQKERWEELLQKARDEGLVVSLNTNGIYTDKVLDKLIKVNPDEISVSLDGGEEHNDYLRGKGNFKKAIESIKSLKLADCRVTINSGITSITTEEDIRTLLDFAGEYCDNISFFYIRPLGRALNIKDKLLNFYELSKLMKKIDSIKREYFPPELSLKDNKQVLNSIGQDHARNFNLMRGGVDGFTRFNILPNGDLYAGGCALYVNEDLKEELKLENIVKEGFSILNVWRFNPKLMGIRKKSSELQKQCEECKEYKLDCSGFTLEMELYGGLNPEGNPYCNKK